MTTRYFFSTTTRRVFATGIFTGFSVAATNRYANSIQQRQDEHEVPTSFLASPYLPFFSSSSSPANVGYPEAAQCGSSKAPDTPEYLIPYYLRDTKSRFIHYATIKDGKVRKMNPEDFLAAMLAIPEGAISDDLKLENESSMKKFSKFFKWADADGDGTINFREFAFLANILAYPTRDFKVLFRMFDEKNKGGLTREEFCNMLISVSDEKMCPKYRSGIVRAMFLPDEFKKFCSGDVNHQPAVRPAKKQTQQQANPDAPSRMIADKVPADAIVTFERFSAVVKQIELMIAETEFNLYDRGNKGHVTNEEFGNMITRSIHGRHLPFFIVDNLRRLAKQESNNKVHLGTYLLFSEIISRADDVAHALQLYSAGGFVIKANDLKRALDRVVKLSRPISLEESQLITTMFDSNSDGELHIEEFISILRARASYCGVLPKDREKVNLFSRFGKCGFDAVKQIQNGGVLPEEDDE